jgi:hypothetical protein
MIPCIIVYLKTIRAILYRRSIFKQVNWFYVPPARNAWLPAPTTGPVTAMPVAIHLSGLSGVGFNRLKVEGFEGFQPAVDDDIVNTLIA